MRKLSYNKRRSSNGDTPTKVQDPDDRIMSISEIISKLNARNIL